jgi:hypothetical protein
MFEKEVINLTCTKCKTIHSKKISWLKSNNQVTCSCGTIIKVDSKDIHKKIIDIETKIKNLSK